jgi:hypothetical protein
MKKVSLLTIVLLVGTLVMSAALAPGPVSVVLRNGSATSIPLKIENVMNPNLSPFSNSSVTCEEGTRIFYKKKGKWVEIMEITSDLDGDTLRVDKLLKELNLR